MALRDESLLTIDTWLNSGRGGGRSSNPGFRQTASADAAPRRRPTARRGVVPYFWLPCRVPDGIRLCRRVRRGAMRLGWLRAIEKWGSQSAQRSTMLVLGLIGMFVAALLIAAALAFIFLVPPHALE
jgi:hypothetical protein